ncbi:antireceptor [Streptococcus gallolyticus subsp. gallolyticus]|uniref:antireceptor n=1 Tax=Streptococcus gallolyticus TaxID=315405 RepID=UPI002283A968|nr:antireceptor [Streptococcus gallolyticus]MCY7152248.1 antireceptor [Streptococcus gallolyticus subsp. gallolyticus]
MQLTIHDAHLKKVAFIDNEKPKTLNFYDDTWTRNLQTGSSTYEFSISKKQLVSDTVLERTYNYLNERSFVSFEYKGKTYLFNVMTVEEDEKKIKCYCENLNLELINEYSNAYEADRAMTFVEYCNSMDLLSMPKLSIGINEISDYKRTLKWEGQDTKLARLISLANKFDAEIDFETFLNADSTIKSFLVNVYHENDGNYHGVGRVRKDITLVYGKNLKSIKRKIDKTGIFNMTVPSSSDTVEDEPIDTGESSAKTVVTKNADGSVTKTTTKKASDGTTVQTKVTTKVVDNADGSRVTTVRTEKSNGLITEKVTTRAANGNTDTQTKTIREATSETAETVDEHITLSGLPDWEIKNDSGVVEFYKRGEALYAPISAQLYPSTFTSDTQGDQWIRRDLTFDVETDTQLQTEALKQLKAAAYPELTYEFDGYIDADIGDTVQISDSGFTNMLLLEARIFGQKLSFSSEKNWKTTLGNFKALQNMLSSDIQAELEKLVDDAKPYTIRISSDNGIAFKNGEGESTIKATLWKGNKVLDADVTWRWALDGNVSVGMQYLAKASTIKNTAVLTVSAYIGNNEVATTEITLTNVNDGAEGEQGPKGDKGDDGAKGDKGETGNGIANTVITYGLSTSETTEPATWASNMPVLVKGMYLWTRTVQIYTNGKSTASYQKGYIAKDGAQGLPGKDAQTQYTHIAYADNATGGGFSLTDNTKAYWGMYQDFNAANSNDPTKYKWSKWKGDQGLPGKPGADGKTPYIHFAYADDNKGTNLSFTDKNQQYQGYYSDYTEANSTDYKKYTWVDRLANVKGGSRNYFKNSLTKTFYTTDAQTFDWRTYIVDAFWKNKDRLKKNFVKISFDITFPVALENDYTANIHFSATPWYSNQVIFKAGTTSRQHFEFGIDLSSASEDYHTDNVFIRFGTNYGFPSNFKIILENMMLSIGSYYPDYIQAIEDTQEQIDSKADSALTQEQLNVLAEKNRTLEAELEAKAALETVEAWKKAYDDYITQNNQDKTEAEQKLITLTNRVAEWVKDWEDKKVQWSFLDTNMDFGAEGLRLGKKGSPTSILISNDRIGFYSGGTEVASMSNGTLTIDNGIFAKSLQIGHYREEVYEGDSNINVIRWVD